MANYGVKISKAGTDVTDVPTATTKKNFVVLSTDSVHKVSAQAVVAADTNVAHGLVFAPFWDAYILQNTLTEAHPVSNYWAVSYEVACDSTYLYCDEIYGSNSLFYIIYLDQP